MDLLFQLTRIPFMKAAWRRFPIGSVESKVLYGIYARPHYAYGVYWSACLASRLGVPRITVIELGVGGGQGLLALEQVSAEVSAHFGVEIDVVGFDSGEGMPPPLDYRDLPHVWNVGFYKMDREKLQARLRSARLVIGDVASTIREHVIEAPVAFVAVDLDYYSSTRAALTLFDRPDVTHLPRVHCYFDDLGCTDLGCMNVYVGEYLAIREFNDAHADRKICRIEQLRLNRPTWERWQDRMYAFHDFAHPQYTTLVLPREDEFTQMPL